MGGGRGVIREVVLIIGRNAQEQAKKTQRSLDMFHFNPVALRKAKIVYNFECDRASILFHTV